MTTSHEISLSLIHPHVLKCSYDINILIIVFFIKNTENPSNIFLKDKNKSGMVTALKR